MSNDNLNQSQIISKSWFVNRMKVMVITKIIK